MSRAQLNKLMDDINKQYGTPGARPVIGLAGDMADQRFIPASSPALAYALGREGWPEGKLVELIGKEHAGKTTLGVMALQDAYRFYEGERKMLVVDLEHRFNMDWAYQLGVTVEDVILLQPDNVEDATDIQQRMIKTGDIAAVLFDSIGSAAPVHEQKEFSEASTRMGGAAKELGRNMRTIAPLANRYATLCVYTNQWRDDMSGYNRVMTPGGWAVKHGMSLRIVLKALTQDKFYISDPGQEESKTQVGFGMNFKVIKNTYGPPERQQKSKFYYQPSELFDGIGFDVEDDYARLGLLLGLVERAGAWYSWGDIRTRGRDAFFQELRDQDVFEQYIKEVHASFGKDVDTNDPELSVGHKVFDGVSDE